MINTAETPTEVFQESPSSSASSSPEIIMSSTSHLLTGRVVRTQSGFFTVETPSGLITCQISGKIKIDAKRAVNRDGDQRRDLVALNDFVTLEMSGVDTGTIVDVAERRNILSRVEPGATVGTAAESEQIILANTDQAVFILAAKKPDPNPRALDRMLIIAEKAKIASIVICLNKIDLVNRPKTEALFAIYEQIGYTVIYTSVVTGEGIERLRDILTGEANKVSVFTGQSGVGKSTLLNALQPGLTLATSEVSDTTTKGRHTTRFSQLIKFNAGGYVADTPGIRSIAPWDIEPDELDNYFVEMRPYIENCKFADCSHSHEPGCAVRKAVEDGKITSDRYESYQRLREELEEQYIY